MKPLLVAITYLVASVNALASPIDPVSFDFQSVPLVSMMQATYKNLLHRDYVISPAVLAMDKRMSVSVKALPVDNVSSFVDGLLASEGVQVRKGDDGIYYLGLRDSAVAPGVDVPGPASSSPAGSAVPGPSPVVERVHDLVKIYQPMNRSSEFMVAVLNAAFGNSVARPGGAAVVLSAPKERIEAVLDLAEQLDVLPRNVEVSASFVEVSASESGSSGLSLVASVLGARVGLSLGGTGGALTVSKGGFQLVLDALAADGRFKQVSNSRVVGDEAERVSLSVGDETPTLQSNGRDNAGNTVQNIVYRPSGVILDVLPKVLGSGRLSLLVDGQVSSFKATVTGVTGSPTLSKRQVKTAVTLRDGDVLIVGGLEDSTVTSEHSGLSFLPKSWSASSRSDRRTDLVLVLSAKVLARN
jgi:general secretion pathway protein D